MKDGNLRLAMFDCDGTLVDSANFIIKAMSMAWSAAGLGKPPSPKRIRSVTGLHLLEAIKFLHPDGEPEDLECLVEYYKDAFSTIRKKKDYHELLYEGVKETINSLNSAGILLGIATGKSRQDLNTTLQRHELLESFVILKCSDDGPGKPNPRILLDAMKELGIDKRDAVMIGDTTFDMEMAVNAKIIPIGVDWGYHEADELKVMGAKRILHKFCDLEETLHILWGEF